MRDRKIGIMGGTFNPIHNGHLIIAENALHQFQLDKVVFIPAGVPPHKRDMGITDGNVRCTMVNLAIEDNPGFCLSDMEIRSQGTSYTYLTLERIKEIDPQSEIYFIMGADSLHDFPTWRNPKRICELSHLLVAVRDELEISKLANIAEQIRRDYNADIDLLNTPNVEISSKDIRRRLQDDEPIRYMVPEKVREFILKNQVF